MLAVGLGNTVYFWNEDGGVESPPALNPQSNAYVSSLSFSSREGCKAILGTARSNGHLCLYSPLESEPRFNIDHPSPLCCVAFRPNTASRVSLRDPNILVETEELLVGDELGHVWIYSIEWPSDTDRDIFNWDGSLTLLCRITVHTQQICGLAWAPNGDSFATGGNDNLCHLFDTRRVLAANVTSSAQSHSAIEVPFVPQRRANMSSPSFNLSHLYVRHCFTVAAAVKAIAFCPWQRGLIAIGGSSNDRRIHFFHTLSGATLATLDCHAQVTSLVWSTTRREIAATFGFAQPEHPYRIAVFNWPTCDVVVKIPWFDEHRALFAILYPGGPNGSRERPVPEVDPSAIHSLRRSRRRTVSSRARWSQSRDHRREGGIWWSRTEEEGCLVVATSDCSIKFHEIWAEEKRTTEGKGGMLGGSEILDMIHGIDRNGTEIIR
jgi:hypothetical protein